MTRLKVVHLLDDLAMGGVMKGLSVFESGAAAERYEHRLVPIGADALVAPRLDADIIVTHMPPNWRRLMLFASIRLVNPRARHVHVEHSYTRSLEALKVRHRPRFRAMLALAMRIPHRCVCVSRAQRAWLIEAARLDRAVEVIHPCSDNPGLLDLPLPGGDGGRPLAVVAYGRYSPEKGFDRLIAAARAGAFDGCTLRLAGAGPEEAKLRAMAEGLPHVEVGGRVDDIAAFLADADVVAVPSRFEAYGQVANEAREAGRPILVAPTDGLVEQVGRAGLLVDFDSPEAVRAALASMTAERRMAMGAAGRAAVRFGTVVRRRQWADLFDRLVAPHPVAAEGMRMVPA